MYSVMFVGCTPLLYVINYDKRMIPQLSVLQLPILQLLVLQSLKEYVYHIMLHPVCCTHVNPLSATVTQMIQECSKCYRMLVVSSIIKEIS